MFTIKKLWAALNHAGKPWQISLAVALALIVGLTPFVSLHNILIILFVLVLNVHIGIFILASGFFSGIAYIFDPKFHQIGLSILTNDSLNSLFTTFYNNPAIYLSQFNNTIMMGSLVVCLILFLPVLILVNVFIVKYRGSIATKFQNIPLLNKITYFQEEQKKVKTFRFAGIIVLVILIVPVVVFSKFYLDSMVKEQLEKQISKNTQKEVFLKSVSVGLLTSSVEIKGILVVDKKDDKKNIAIDRLNIDINLLNLIFKKVVVDDILVENINFPNHIKKVVKKEKTKPQTTDDKFDFKQITKLSKIDISNINKLQDVKLKEYYNTFKEYYKKIKPIFNKATAQKEEKIVYKRGVGSFIKFSDNTNIPKLLVKKGSFSIDFEDIIYKGGIKDFTTDQNRYQKPFLLNILSSSKKFKELKANISILETKKIQKDTLDVVVNQFKADDYLSKDFSILDTLVNSKISLDIKNGKKISSVGKIDILSTNIELKDSNRYIAQLNESLKGTKNINSSFKIQGDLENPNMKFDSNLEKVLRLKIKEFINSQKSNIKNEIKDKAEKEIKKKIGNKVEKKMGDKLKGVFKF